MNKILIVDDNVELLETFSEILEKSGYETDTYSSARKALHQVNQKEYDLIISDINMPLISGIELLNRIRNTVSYTIPVILMTGEITTDYAIQAIKSGASDFIPKPIDTDALLKSVEFNIRSNKQKYLKIDLKNMISDVCIEYRIKPSDFLKKNFPGNIINHINQMLDMPGNIFNTVQFCIDEMLQNAFIHGTLNLSIEERSLKQHEYIEMIKKKLEDKNTANSEIKMNYRLNTGNKSIEISVWDKGKGFNFEEHLSDDAECKIDFSPSGRGLSIIKALADSLKFEDSGRKITVTKSYEK
ncbi:MAG: hypothetical protein CSB55_07630 [Candidatus Cloacimonadota bacterium]|nr:MAG: hypothetical protein CSB55_07630 [Candidatus Cloacimonadota bacterium]